VVREYHEVIRVRNEDPNSPLMVWDDREHGFRGGVVHVPWDVEAIDLTVVPDSVLSRLLYSAGLLGDEYPVLMQRISWQISQSSVQDRQWLGRGLNPPLFVHPAPSEAQAKDFVLAEYVSKKWPQEHAKSDVASIIVSRSQFSGAISLYRGVAGLLCVLVACVLYASCVGVVARRGVVRGIVAAHRELRNQCHRCGYFFPRQMQGRCPECGTQRPKVASA